MKHLNIHNDKRLVLFRSTLQWQYTIYKTKHSIFEHDFTFLSTITKKFLEKRERIRVGIAMKTVLRSSRSKS